MEEGSNYKIKIQRGDTVVEIEGDKDFVEAKYQEWKDALQETTAVKTAAEEKQVAEPAIRKKRNKKAVASKRDPEAPKLRDNLKISKADLKSLIDEKKPSGHEEHFLVFTYFLKNKLGLAEVGVDEVFTCYRMMGIKGPKTWQQKFRDAKSRNSWFSRGAETGKYSISTIGEEHILHDMPAKIAVKEQANG